MTSKNPDTNRDKNPPIDFRPVTPGLGFHPFSDGLPYAPMSKTVPRPNAQPDSNPAYRQGTGAVAAGPATFARNLPQAARVQVPTARVQGAPQAQIQAQAQPAGQTSIAPSYGLTYVCKRMLAYCIDTVINLALLCTGLMFALWNLEIRPEVFMNPSLLVLCFFFCLIFNWALITAQEVAFSTSIGKRVFGLALRGTTGSIFLRAFFFIPSVLFCGIGLAWAIFDGQRRCWHDIVVGIQPIEIARL